MTPIKSDAVTRLRRLFFASEHLTPCDTCRIQAQPDVNPVVHTTLIPKKLSNQDDFVVANRPGPRFLMWVDAVGGYLVCLSDKVLVGQAIPESAADIQVFGDLSRHHAVIKRYGEGYMVEPQASMQVDHQPINQPRTLADGDEIDFGPSVSMRFRQPHALSSTSRLEPVSHHRTQPMADGIILMSNTCILGPNESNHVVCRGWENDVVLIRQGDKLRCQSKSELEVDGKMVKHKAEIGFNSRICGDDFCISLEQIE